MFLINFNQWKCACVGINNWVIVFGVSEKRTASFCRVTKLLQVVDGVTSLLQEDETLWSLENACCSFLSARGWEACTICLGRCWRCRSVTVLPAWSARPCGWIFRSGVPPRPTAGCASVGFAVGVCGLRLDHLVPVDPLGLFGHEHWDRAAGNPHHPERSRRPDTTASNFRSITICSAETLGCRQPCSISRPYETAQCSCCSEQILFWRP